MLVIKPITRITPEIIEFVTMMGEEQGYDNKFPGWRSEIVDFVMTPELKVIAHDKEGTIKGILLARLTRPVFTPWIRVLRQISLYSKTPRACKMLMDYMIDFGKARADHIVTMIGVSSNLKPQSLKNLGFSEIETHYRMEVSK